uniref:Uncharacterized protein n=1 Tax=Anguilla anguilla TaxID=7936 RepID=A0A0E9SE83_ANGAN
MCQILTDDDDDNDQDDSYQSAPHLQNTEHHVIERQWLSVTSDKISTNTSLWRHTVTSLFKQLLEFTGSALPCFRPQTPKRAALAIAKPAEVCQNLL